MQCRFRIFAFCTFSKLALMTAEVAASGAWCARINLSVVYSMSQPVVGSAGRRSGRPRQGGRITAARCQPRIGHRRRLHLERQSITLLLLQLVLLLKWNAAHYDNSSTSDDVTRSQSQ